MDGYDGVMRVGISATECDFKSRNPEPEEGGNPTRAEVYLVGKARGGNR